MAAFNWDESVRVLCSLPTCSEHERVEAVAALVRSTSPAIRRRALRLGADVFPDEMLVSWLRENADDVLRNAGLEILKLRGGRAFSLVRELASDRDPDVVLQVALLLDHYRDARGVTVLRSLLDHPDTNVVQAAIVGLGHHRDPAVIRSIAAFLEADVWLQIAAIQALGDIGDASALPLLEPLLADEFLESFASEAIAHVGGQQAFGILAGYWLAAGERIDSERYVSLLASVMVQLPYALSLDAEMENAIVRQLDGPGTALRVAAATLLLAAGSISRERVALEVLASAADASPHLPPCLARRGDLTSLLLERSGIALEWGLQLAGRHPGSASAREIAEAVLRDELPEHLAEACSALAHMSSDAAAASVVSIFVGVPADRRRELHAAIRRHAGRILEILPIAKPNDADDLVLGALAGLPVDTIVARITALDDETRRNVVAQIFVREDVIEALPWNAWLAVDATSTADLLADAVMDANLVSAAPLLRQAARTVPSARVVEALGCVGDDPALQLLEEMLSTTDGRVRAFVWNALGRVGGERARAIFSRHAPDLGATEAKFAYRSWAACATRDDQAHFRAIASHPDWLVRAAAAEVLARYADPANSEVLSALALDPVESVAEKAVAINVALKTAR